MYNSFIQIFFEEFRINIHREYSGISCKEYVQRKIIRKITTDARYFVKKKKEKCNSRQRIMNTEKGKRKKGNKLCFCDT